MHVVLLILSLAPFAYKILFWLYVIQLKEYRWDRFKEYLGTPQGKKALFFGLAQIEITFFVISFGILFGPAPLKGSIIYVMFFFLVLYNIFVWGKIFRGKLLKPKMTNRLALLLFVLLIGLSLDIYFLVNSYIDWTYTYIMSILVFTPFIIFLCNFIILPIVNHKKNKLIKAASKKSEKLNKPIKIGITGSYGKSSVKEFLSSILEKHGKTLKTPENINTELGVSDIVLKELKNDYDYFVAEMGAYRIGEIDTLGNIVNHKYGFLTAIGNQHLGLFGSIQNTQKAKFEIAHSVLKNNGVLYINGDNKLINEFLEINLNGSLKGLKYIKYGLDGENLDAKGKIISIKAGNTIFDLDYKGEKYRFETNLIGEHNILNLVGVVALCIDLGITNEKLKEYLVDIKKPKNTLEIKTKRIKKDNKEINIILIDDTHNLSIESLYAGLKVIEKIDCDQVELCFDNNDFERILLVDDILELGKKSKEIHYEAGNKVAREALVDKVLYVGANFKKDFVRGLIDGGFDEKNIVNRLDEITKNTIILFEGSRSFNYLSKF